MHMYMYMHMYMRMYMYMHMYMDLYIYMDVHRRAGVSGGARPSAVPRTLSLATVRHAPVVFLLCSVLSFLTPSPLVVVGYISDAS